MLALAASIKIRAKIDEKSYVFLDFDFEGILGGFWKVLGTQNPRFSHFFRYFFDAKFRVQLGRAKNRKKVTKNIFGPNFGAALRYVRSWGEGL